MDRFRYVTHVMGGGDGNEWGLNLMGSTVSALMEDGWALHGETQFLKTDGGYLAVQPMKRIRYSIGDDGHLREIG